MRLLLVWREWFSLFVLTQKSESVLFSSMVKVFWQMLCTSK